MVFIQANFPLCQGASRELIIPDTQHYSDNSCVHHHCCGALWHHMHTVERNRHIKLH